MRTTPLALASLSILVLSACSAAAPIPADPQDDVMEAPILTDPQDGAMEGMPHVTIGWLLEDKGTDEVGMQTSTVSLAVRTSANDVKLVTLGTYVGCGETAMPPDGALLTLTCWWAGGGDEFQVRMEGTNTLSIDHRGLDEMVDIPDFAPMKSIEIPTGSMIMTAKTEEI